MMEFCKNPEISHAREKFTAVNFSVAITDNAINSRNLTDVNNSHRRREMWDLDVASYDIGVSIARIHQIYSGSENIFRL